MLPTYLNIGSIRLLLSTLALSLTVTRWRPRTDLPILST